MHYSASTNSFLDPALRERYTPADWPSDAKPVSDEIWRTFGQLPPPPGKKRVPNESGDPSWADLPEPEAPNRKSLITAIDFAAGAARLRYVSAGQLIEEEYRQALHAVRAWRAAGSPADDVPAEIQSGAEYSGITHEAAAVEIEQTAADWEGVLALIRDLRLNGKAAVKAAADDTIESVAAGYIEQLDAMKPALEG